MIGETTIQPSQWTPHGRAVIEICAGPARYVGRLEHKLPTASIASRLNAAAMSSIAISIFHRSSLSNHHPGAPSERQQAAHTLPKHDLHITHILSATMSYINTTFDKHFSSYREARSVIDSTNTLIRALDDARRLSGVSKAELARQIDARSEVVRRLFTADDANPTLATVLKLVDALGFHLELVPNPPAAQDAAT